MKARYSLLALALFIPTAAEAQLGAGFGSTLAMEGDAIFVGKARTGTGAGTVYVFGRETETQAWVERQRLVASDAEGQSDNFGRAMTTSGNSLFVGAIGSDDSHGAVYVFTLQDGMWIESAKLVASDAAEDHRFGNALVAHGNRLLVSAIGPSYEAGAVYIFERDDASGTWSEHAILRGSDAGPYEAEWRRMWRMSVVPVSGFGPAMALGEHTAAISAPAFGGSVMMYSHDPNSDTWAITDTLNVEGQEPAHLFGYALAMEGDELFVAAPRYSDNQGVIFRFVRSSDAGEWKRRGHLSGIFQTHGYRLLGFKLNLDGSDLWTTAPMHNGGMGSLYHYSRDADTRLWRTATQFNPKDLLFDASSARGLCEALVVKGDIALCGAPASDHGEGKALVLQNKDGRWTESAQLINDSRIIPSIVGAEVVCKDGEADRFDCSNVDMLSFLSVADLGGSRGVEVNDLWGWTDPETGREWALIGRIDGTAMVDVTDPKNPIFVGDLPKTDKANSSTWRDIKVYQNHAFIVADGAGDHGMQVFDLRQLRAVESPPVTFEASAHYTGIASAHNIVINEGAGFAYAVGSSMGGETCGGGLHMIDIRNPIQPTFAGCFADSETGRASSGYSHDAQCVNYRGPDAEHRGKEICFGANETALSISDVSDKDNPVKLSNASYPNYGYSHQGWLTEDHSFFYMNDELDEIAGSVDGTRTLVWDVSDLDDPQLAMEHVSENKASDHNLYIVGDLMYQSNYQSGLRILDITKRTSPVEVGFFDTVPYGENVPSFGGSWSNYPFFKSGIIVVTSGNEGMFILKKRNVDA